MSSPLTERMRVSALILKGHAVQLKIVSLPGDPDTLRGHSAPKLIIKDEAAYVSDAMQAALEPMPAVSEGRLIEMSSPNGKRGHFYENWQHGVGVERIKIIGRECPRIGSEFLDKMRQKLGPNVNTVGTDRIGGAVN